MCRAFARARQCCERAPTIETYRGGYSTIQNPLLSQTPTLPLNADNNRSCNSSSSSSADVRNLPPVTRTHPTRRNLWDPRLDSALWLSPIQILFQIKQLPPLDRSHTQIDKTALVLS